MQDISIHYNAHDVLSYHSWFQDLECWETEHPSRAKMFIPEPRRLLRVITFAKCHRVSRYQKTPHTQQNLHFTPGTWYAKTTPTISNMMPCPSNVSRQRRYLPQHTRLHYKHAKMSSAIQDVRHSECQDVSHEARRSAVKLFGWLVVWATPRYPQAAAAGLLSFPSPHVACLPAHPKCPSAHDNQTSRLLSCLLYCLFTYIFLSSRFRVFINTWRIPQHRTCKRNWSVNTNLSLYDAANYPHSRDKHSPGARTGTPPPG